MHSLVEDIQQRMAKYPHARVEYDDSSITYIPDADDGFKVRLLVIRQGVVERYSVFYNGSHEEFDNKKWAIEVFAFGLSTGCRLREYSRNGHAYRWVVETWDHRKQEWKADWEIVQVFWWLGHWRQRPVVRVLQNRLINLEDGGAGTRCTLG